MTVKVWRATVGNRALPPLPQAGKPERGFGRKPDDTDMEGFQGIHARRVLVIFDEGCGIPQLLWTAADTLIANEESRFFVIGNPDDPASEFAIVCRPGSGWNVITISAFETPNFRARSASAVALVLKKGACGTRSAAPE